MNKSESIAELSKAMAKAQSQMGAAIKDADNPFFKSKYADLSEVVKAVKKPFSDNGLSYVQFPIEENGRIGIETILMHSSGEWLSHKFTVHLTKNDAQGAGSALTYCRRYALQAVSGVPSADDDGNFAVQEPEPKAKEAQNNKATPAQLDAQKLIDALADDEFAAIGFWRSLANKGNAYQEKVYSCLDRDVQKVLKKLSAQYPVQGAA